MRAFLAVVFFGLAIGTSVAASDEPPIPPPRAGESESAHAVRSARERGVRSAQADIKRHVFRILDYGEPLPPDTPQRVDLKTLYRVESIAGCEVTKRFVAEVDAYNDAMRAWHK